MKRLVTPLRDWARSFKRQTLVVYLVARDRRTPWTVRLLALAVAAYALSPIDLIPDFIPVIGYLDDLLLLPLALALILRLTPPDILTTASERAAAMSERPISYPAAACIVVLWGLLGLAAYRWLLSLSAGAT